MNEQDKYRYAVYIGPEGDRGYFRDTDKLPNRVVVKINPKDVNRLKVIRNIHLIKSFPHKQPEHLRKALEKKWKKKDNEHHIPSSKI